MFKIKINGSNLLRAGLNEYKLKEEHYNAIEKSNIRVFKIFELEAYGNVFEEFDRDMDDNVKVEIVCVKCRGSKGKHIWVVLRNRKPSIIQFIEQLELYSDQISFDQSLGFTYIIKSNYGYKIGKSYNVHNRAKIFGVKIPFEFEFVRKYKCPFYNKLERALHEFFSDKKIDGEWFDLTKEDLALVDQCLLTNSIVPLNKEEPI